MNTPPSHPSSTEVEKDPIEPTLPPELASVRPTPEEPAFAEIALLRKWLRQGRTTPTRLTEYFLDRLTRHGPKYNAVVTVTPERALREAKRAEEELAAGKKCGPLHGIPYGVKDLLATRDVPTTWGAAPFREQRFEEDCTVVRKLSAAGAVLVAKLAMVELAGGMGYKQANASFSGPGLNPWNRKAWSGGSSTGPGSAVAAGLVPLAIGSETWGSIVTPAAFCGVTGLRPTYGRVSRHGAMALAWTLDKLGPITRSARDAAWTLTAIAGPDPHDPTTLPQPFRGMAASIESKQRFAVFEDAEAGLEKEVAENYRESLELLSEFGELIEVKLPDFPFGSATDIILSAEMASAMEELIGSEAAMSLQAPEDRIGGIANELILAKDYIRALRLRGEAITILDDWLRPFDALVSPTRATVASPIEQNFRKYFQKYHAPPIGGPGNLVGLPCVCIPNGFGARGLPTSIQFVGRALSEARLLRIAHEVQKRTPWHRKYPKV